MSKYLLEDITKIKHQRKENAGTKNILEEREIETNHIKNRPRYLLWFVAFISVAFFLFALSLLFSKAEIRVNPKMKDMILSENLSVERDSNTDNLSFDLVIISGEENKIVQATEERDFAVKATGTILIFNAFSFSSQRLDVDTRLEGSNGKIYKTQTKVIVPGMNKNGTPGKVEVGIYGAEAGQDYNSAPLDFKIFGFRGTSKYSKFYGRSEGEITGGFKGKSPVLSDALKTSTINELKENLQAKLSKKVTDQIPPGFILFQNATLLNIVEENIPFTFNDGNVPIKINGTLYGILFNEQKLTKKIAEDNIEKYDGGEIYIPNIKDLIFTLANKDNVSFDNLQSIDFNLSGPAKIVWKLDVNKFTADLLGKSKNNFNQILSQYPNIDSATLILSPFWKMSIPNETKNIKVIVNYPQ